MLCARGQTLGKERGDVQYLNQVCHFALVVAFWACNKRERAESSPRGVASTTRRPAAGQTDTSRWSNRYHSRKALFSSQSIFKVFTTAQSTDSNTQSLCKNTPRPTPPHPPPRYKLSSPPPPPPPRSPPRKSEPAASYDTPPSADRSDRPCSHAAGSLPWGPSPHPPPPGPP